MVLKRKLSRACAFIVSTDLCDELATVDHLAMNSRSAGHLMTHKRTRHTGSCSELHRWSHMYILFLSFTVNTFCTFISLPRVFCPPTEVKSQMCHSNCPSQWPFSCLFSNQIITCPSPFIWCVTHHLLSLAWRLWFALISWWSLCHITVFVS